MRAMSIEQESPKTHSSQLIAQSNINYDDSASFHESQIRKADSLYKNYLPQYNFDEVKAAMEFFDSLQLIKTTVNRQRTTDFFHRIFPNRKQKDLCTVPEPVEGTTSGASTSSAISFPQTVDRCPLSVDYYESQIRKADSLYKNYLPQANFEEVKAAMEFFDSLRLTTDNSQQTTDFFNRIFPNRKQKDLCTVPEPVEGTTFGASTSSASSFPRTVDCCPLSVDFICAKAHYYHAVGLTEKDDIVGACEHYLLALEIMEKMMAKDKRLKAKGKGLCDSASLRLCDSDEDYEKIRFVYLIHTRLGELFLSETCCDLSLINYKKALYYSNVIDNKLSTARTLKHIGYSYQMLNNADSALYFYNKSLRTSNDIDNKLDIDKCIAQIIYLNKGKRDSAYLLLKNNLGIIDNENVKSSYCFTLGNMFYIEKVYDSALYYMENYQDNNNLTTKLAFATTLSAIYDSLGNYEKKAYYDNISSKLLKNNINKEVDKAKFRDLYNNYDEKKAERIRVEAQVITRRNAIIVSLTAFIMVVLIIVYIKCNHRKQSNKLKTVIDDCVNRIDNYSKDIENKNTIINQKEKLISDYQKANDKKDKTIEKQKIEIERIKNRLSKKNVNIEAYYASDICKKILSRKDNDFSCLKEDELALLLKSADEHLDNISERLRNKFPSLNKNDIYTICLLILNLEKKLPVLLGRNPKTIWDRLHKLKKLINVESNKDLYIYINDNFLD